MKTQNLDYLMLTNGINTMGLFNRECKHLYGQVDENGYQYCSLCGLARSIPRTINDCQHEWVEKGSYNVTSNGNTKKTIFLLRCKKCGDLKQEIIE